MKSLIGTKTAENLLKSFAGESQARNRYTFYAKVADKEDYKQMKDIFMETAENEKEHAKRFYKFLLAGLGKLPAMVEIKATYPVAQGDTLENLKTAAAGENEEWTKLYPEFASVAAEEGFEEVSKVFKEIAKIEEQHEIRYLKMAENIEKNRVFKREKETLWKCNNCGYVHKGTSAPDTCPACDHPIGYFQLFIEAY